MLTFARGATIGAAIPLGNNWNNTTTSNVNIGTYIGFMVLMAFGAFLALGMASPNKVIRSDGTHVSLHKFSNWKREAIEVFKLFINWRMLILIPLFAGSNWFYTYQFQVYNGGGYFNLRARSLNNMLYWLFQIIGGGFIGWMLDSKMFGGRRQRAIIGNTFVLVICVALWIGAIFVQKNFTYESAKALATIDKTDVFSPNYAGLAVEYAFFGFMDSIYQGFIYWLMGTMTNDTERAARYGGFYKTIQNAFAAVASQLDAQRIPFMTQLIVVFAVNVVGILLAYVVCFTVPDVTVEEIDNLQGVAGKETIVGGRLEDDAGAPNKLEMENKEYM